MYRYIYVYTHTYMQHTCTHIYMYKYIYMCVFAIWKGLSTPLKIYTCDTNHSSIVFAENTLSAMG